MSLSQETINRINHFRRFEALYQPNDEVKRAIGCRTLAMIVAPAAMGKSYLMNRTAVLERDYGRSTTLSTRQPRADDEPGVFRLAEQTDEDMNGLLDKILSGDLVQYKFHPTEHTFYGSEAVDHPHQHNMLPTLSGAIEQLQNVGFKETTVYGLVAPPTSWMSWFNKRYPLWHDMRLRRLQEAEISYTDMLLRDDVTWLVNREGEIDTTVEQLINPDRIPAESQKEAISYAHRILQLTQDAKRVTESQKYE